jgi:hypothetical protein
VEPGRKTYITLAGLAGLAAVLFAISGIGRFKNADHGLDWVIGGIGWFGGLLTVLAILILGVRTIMLARRRARKPRGLAA